MKHACISASNRNINIQITYDKIHVSTFPCFHSTLFLSEFPVITDELCIYQDPYAYRSQHEELAITVIGKEHIGNIDISKYHREGALIMLDSTVNLLNVSYIHIKYILYIHNI